MANLEYIAATLMEKATRNAGRHMKIEPMPVTLPSKCYSSHKLPHEVKKTNVKSSPKIRRTPKRVKTASVWRYYTELPNVPAVTCNLCGAQIATKSSSTTGMIRHMNARHQEQYKTIILNKKNASTIVPQYEPCTSVSLPLSSTALHDFNQALSDLILSVTKSLLAMNNPLIHDVFKGNVQSVHPVVKTEIQDESAHLSPATQMGYFLEFLDAQMFKKSDSQSH